MNSQRQRNKVAPRSTYKAFRVVAISEQHAVVRDYRVCDDYKPRRGCATGGACSECILSGAC